MLFKIGKILVAIFVIWLFLLVAHGFNLFYFFFPPECETLSDLRGESSHIERPTESELVLKTLDQMCASVFDLD